MLRQMFGDAKNVFPREKKIFIHLLERVYGTYTKCKRVPLTLNSIR
jgi:hypothetical protein